MASEQPAVAPLTSAALRGMPHHAAELGSTLPVLHSDLPGLHADQPGLRPDLLGSSVPLSGEHVPPPRGHAGEVPQGRDRRRSEVNFPGIMQEYSRMLLRPTPLQQPTGPLQPCLRALLVSTRPLPMSARPLLVSSPWMPDVPRLLSLSPVLLGRERDCRTRESRWAAVGIIFSGHYAGVQQDAVAPHSTTAAHRTAPALAPRAARGGPSVTRPTGLGHSRAAATASETAEQKNYLDYGGLKMDRISEVAPVQEVC